MSSLPADAKCVLDADMPLKAGLGPDIVYGKEQIEPI
jgi:hypothetical protein